jgi:hypothetical protein
MTATQGRTTAAPVMPVRIDQSLAWRAPILAGRLGDGFTVSVGRPGTTGIALLPPRAPEQLSAVREAAPDLGIVVIADWATRRDAAAIAEIFKAGADAYFDGHSLTELIALLKTLARRVPAVAHLEGLR